MAFFRLAKTSDFDALYEIWMQDHINPFMSFERISKEDFRPIFDALFKHSEIHVLEDDNGQVVAVRRIGYGTGEYAHTAFFASFGVHENHLGKKYAKQFYDYFISKLRDQPDITRVELTQETDNPRAYKLALDSNFKIEATSPDWLIRTTGTHKNKWFIGEQFLALLLDPAIETNSKKFDEFDPMIPSLINPKKIDEKMLSVVEEGTKIHCYYNNQLQATLNVEEGIRRYDHIQFWSLDLQPNYNQEAIQQFLRQQVLTSSTQYKKIEVLISDDSMLESIASLGFHYRGQKIASRKINEHYYNEVYADFGLFNVDDAQLVLNKSDKIDDYKRGRIAVALKGFQKIIDRQLNEQKIDLYGYFYLGNLVFQIVRETVFEVSPRYKNNPPWPNLIQSLPTELKNDFVNLAKIIDPEFQPKFSAENVVDLSDESKIHKNM